MNTAFAIGTIVLLGGFYAWTSRMNGMFFFGRSAGAELRSGVEGRAITRQYLTAMVLTTCAVVLLAWLADLGGRHFAPVGIVVEWMAFWIFFARANRQVRRLAMSQGVSPVRETIVQVSLSATPSYWIPSLLMAMFPAVLAAVVGAAVIFFTGKGASWGESWNSFNASLEAHHLDALLGMSLGLLSSATILLLVFRTSVRLRTTMAQYTIRASVLLEWIGVGLLFTVLGCNYLGMALTRHTNRIFVFAGVAAAFATVAWNQARAKRFVPPPVELGDDDRWRWGLFYVDRNDPALFVQSRCGAGYTLNYGRVLAWPISVATVAYLVSMLFLTSRR